jgi:hypothetical protein
MLSAPQNPSPPPAPFNDALVRALSPIQEMMTQRQKVEGVMRKYGRQMPHRYQGPPVVQWEGDTNG